MDVKNQTFNTRRIVAAIAFSGFIWAGLPPQATAQIRVDARMHTSSTSCAQCNLSGREMAGMRLQDSDFSGAQFNNSNLSGGNFDRTDLSDTQFRRAFLARIEGNTVNMADATLHGATLTEAKLNESILINTDFRRADLSRATFTDSNFTKANLSGAIAPNVNFEGSEFQDARFDHVNLMEARLDSANFSGVKFGNALLNDATMANADFSDADLSYANGLTQTQLDTACGNENTRLPIGLSVPYCENVAVTQHDIDSHERLPAHIEKAAARMDKAILDIEALMRDSDPQDRKLRRKLESIHSDMTSSRRTMEKTNGPTRQ